MKRKTICILFIVLFIGLGQQMNLAEQQNSLETYDNPSLDVMTPEDFSWTAFTYERYDFTLPTFDDSIDYSVDETMIYLHELNSFDCIASIYTLVPVTNDHLVISGELRAQAGHIDARNAAVLLKDPYTFTGVNTNIPSILYTKDNSLDSGFQYFGVDYYLPGYTEVILEFSYNDAWGADWGQTLCVKDLKIHMDNELPLRSQIDSTPAITDYDWSFGSFIRDSFSSPSPSLTLISAGDYEHSINSTHVYVGEIDSGTDEALVGAHTTVPVIDDKLALSFNAYATCDVDYRASMQVRFFNSDTKARILKTLEIINYNSINNTIENQYIEFDVSLPGLEEVIILFFYEDGSNWGTSGNDNHKLWISNLNIYNATIEETPEIITLSDLDWETGKFIRDKYYPMQVMGTGGYTYDITADSLHVLEAGDTFDSYVAIYATVPVTNGRFAFSYEARAHANHQFAVSLGVRLIDPVTLRIVEDGIASGYGKRGGYETGWNYAGYNISAEGYSELILYFYYSDAFSAIWNTEFWIKNLKIYTTGETDVYNNRDKFGCTPELDWSIGSFERADYEDMYFPIIEKFGSTDEFSYTIEGNDLHFLETGTGTYDSWVGAYSTITVNNGYVALSYDIRARSNYGSEVSAHCRFFDAVTGRSLGTTIGTGISSPGALEVGYHHYEVNQTLPGHDEVIILFFYSDASLENNDKEFWIKELNIYGSEAGSPYIPDIGDPVISSSGDLTFTEGSIGNYINWTIYDESYGTYYIFENGVPIATDDWISGEFISMNVDYLVEGFYMYNLVAIDASGNQAESTIDVNVNALEIIDTEDPVIFSSGDVAYFEGSTGNYINWTMIDESTGTYVLLRDGLLLEADSWVSGEIISINVDNLAEGVYNYTLIAIDVSGNQAVHSVFAVVAKPERTAFPSMYILLIGFSLILPIIYRRRKKNS